MSISNSRRKSRLFSYALLLINTLTWGAALVVVKPSLEVTTPFRYLLYRFVIAVVLSIPILLYYWPKIKNKFQTIKTITLLEMIGTTASLAFLYIGLARTSAVEASLIANTTPIFVVVAGVLLLKEHEERREWIGLGLAFIGMVFVTLIPLLVGNGTSEISVEGNIFIIIQNVLTALYLIGAKKYYKKIPKFFVTTISFYVASVSFFLLSFWEAQFSMTTLIDSVRHDLQFPSVWIAAGYMALFGSIIGLTAYIKGQENIEASEATIFWYLQPLVYIPLSLWMLGEPTHPLQFVGLAIILLGVFTSEFRRPSRS
ncbi:MAG: DMT family transporter [Microgenomates group bacterium]